MASPEELPPCPKSILGKRNSLLAFGWSEHHLEPASKKSRIDEGDSRSLLLRYASKLQADHTAAMSELHGALQKTVQENDTNITAIAKLQNGYQQERETCTTLRSELETLRHQHEEVSIELTLEEDRVGRLQNQVQMMDRALGNERVTSNRKSEENGVLVHQNGVLVQQNGALTQRAEMQQEQIRNLENHLQIASQALANERAANNRLNQEKSAFLTQIQAQPDRDMEDDNGHAHLQTPDNSEHDIMDDGQTQPPMEHGNTATQSNSKAMTALNDEVAKLRAELQKEQIQRTAAEEGEERYRNLYNTTQQGLMPIPQSSDPEILEPSSTLKYSNGGSATPQAGGAQSNMIESDIDSEDDEVPDVKSLTQNKTVSKPKNPMNSRSSKVEKRNASKGINKNDGTGTGNGINKSARLQDARKIGTTYSANALKKKDGNAERRKDALAKRAAEKRAEEEAAEAKRKEEERLIEEGIPKLEKIHPDLHIFDEQFERAKDMFAAGLSLNEVDEAVRHHQTVFFRDTCIQFYNEEYDEIPKHEVIPNGDYRRFYYHTVVGDEPRLYEVLPRHLNVGAEQHPEIIMPIIIPDEPYEDMEVFEKLYWIKVAALGMFPELLLEAAATFLPRLMLERFTRRLFKGAPISEPSEKTDSDFEWSLVVKRLHKMNSFRRACELYAKGAKKRIPEEPFWPNNFDDWKAHQDSNPYWDDADEPLYLMQELENGLAGVDLA